MVRSRLQGLLLLMVWLAGAVVISLWIAAAQEIGWRQALGALSLVFASMLVWKFWKNSPVGHLSWDGQAWFWESKGYALGSAEHTVVVAFDFQALMLLRLDNPARARMWLWAERKTFAGRWMDFRRAVYSPHRAEALQTKVA